MVLKKVERRTIASIKIIVLEYAMKPPLEGTWVIFCWVCTGGFSEPIIAYYFFVNYRLYLCPVLGKTGMEWEPYVKY